MSQKYVFQLLNPFYRLLLAVIAIKKCVCYPFRYLNDFLLQELKESFSAHSHLGSVRCVATSKNYAASGGADENIHVYDMVNRKGSGTIMQHSGNAFSIMFVGMFICVQCNSLGITSLDGSIIF